MILTDFSEHLSSLEARAAVWCVIQSENSQELLEYNSNAFSSSTKFLFTQCLTHYSLT